MSRPVGPPPYTAAEIALLDTPEKRFIAQAELNSRSEPSVGSGALACCAANKHRHAIVTSLDLVLLNSCLQAQATSWAIDWQTFATKDL